MTREIGFNQPQPDAESWSAYLDPDERILWQGQPDGRTILLRRNDAFFIPFSLLWGGFAVFWNASVWVMGAPLFFKIWGLPFLLIGAYLVFGRFFYDAARRRATRFALTNKRALIATSLFGRSLREKTLRGLNDIELKPATSGRYGSVFLEPAPPFMSQNPTVFFSGGSDRFGFEFIPDAPDVHRLIRDAAQQSR